MTFLLALLSLVAMPCGAVELSVDYQVYDASGRFLERPNAQVSNEFGLNLDTTVYGPVYWRNRVFALGESHRVSWVGYRTELGIKLWVFEIYGRHGSEHGVDEPPPAPGYPVRNSLGARWIIVR